MINSPQHPLQAAPDIETDWTDHQTRQWCVGVAVQMPQGLYTNQEEFFQLVERMYRFTKLVPTKTLH